MLDHPDVRAPRDMREDAIDAPSVGIVAINERLERIHARLAETNYRLAQINERIYGPVPQPNAKAEAPMVDDTMSLLHMIERQLDDAENLVHSI